MQSPVVWFNVRQSQGLWFRKVYRYVGDAKKRRGQSRVNFISLPKRVSAGRARCFGVWNGFNKTFK